MWHLHVHVLLFTMIFAYLVGTMIFAYLVGMAVVMRFAVIFRESEINA